MKNLLAIVLCVVLCTLVFASCEEKCSHAWDLGVEIEGGVGGYVVEYTCLRCGAKHRETITIAPPEHHQIQHGQLNIER